MEAQVVRIQALVRGNLTRRKQYALHPQLLNRTLRKKLKEDYEMWTRLDMDYLDDDFYNNFSKRATLKNTKISNSGLHTDSPTKQDREQTLNSQIIKDISSSFTHKNRSLEEKQSDSDPQETSNMQEYQGEDILSIEKTDSLRRDEQTQSQDIQSDRTDTPILMPSETLENFNPTDQVKQFEDLDILESKEVDADLDSSVNKLERMLDTSYYSNPFSPDDIQDMSNSQYQLDSVCSNSYKDDIKINPFEMNTSEIVYVDLKTDLLRNHEHLDENTEQLKQTDSKTTNQDFIKEFNEIRAEDERQLKTDEKYHIVVPSLNLDPLQIEESSLDSEREKNRFRDSCEYSRDSDRQNMLKDSWSEPMIKKHCSDQNAQFIIVVHNVSDQDLNSQYMEHSQEEHQESYEEYEEHNVSCVKKLVISFDHGSENLHREEEDNKQKKGDKEGNEIDQRDQRDQIDQIDQIDQRDQIDRIDQIDQRDQRDQRDQIDRIDQGNEEKMKETDFIEKEEKEQGKSDDQSKKEPEEKKSALFNKLFGNKKQQLDIEINQQTDHTNHNEIANQPLEILTNQQVDVDRSSDKSQNSSSSSSSDESSKQDSDIDLEQEQDLDKLLTYNEPNTYSSAIKPDETSNQQSEIALNLQQDHPNPHNSDSSSNSSSFSQPTNQHSQIALNLQEDLNKPHISDDSLNSSYLSKPAASTHQQPETDPKQHQDKQNKLNSSESSDSSSSIPLNSETDPKQHQDEQNKLNSSESSDSSSSFVLSNQPTSQHSKLAFNPQEDLYKLSSSNNSSFSSPDQLTSSHPDISSNSPQVINKPLYPNISKTPSSPKSSGNFSYESSTKADEKNLSKPSVGIPCINISKDAAFDSSLEVQPQSYLRHNILHPISEAPSRIQSDSDYPIHTHPSMLIEDFKGFKIETSSMNNSRISLSKNYIEALAESSQYIDQLMPQIPADINSVGKSESHMLIYRDMTPEELAEEENLMLNDVVDHDVITSDDYIVNIRPKLSLDTEDAPNLTDIHGYPVPHTSQNIHYKNTEGLKNRVFNPKRIQLDVPNRDCRAENYSPSLMIPGEPSTPKSTIYEIPKKTYRESLRTDHLFDKPAINELLKERFDPKSRSTAEDFQDNLNKLTSGTYKRQGSSKVHLPKLKKEGSYSNQQSPYTSSRLEQILSPSSKLFISPPVRLVSTAYQKESIRYKQDESPYSMGWTDKILKNFFDVKVEIFNGKGHINPKYKVKKANSVNLPNIKLKKEPSSNIDFMRKLKQHNL